MREVTKLAQGETVSHQAAGLSPKFKEVLIRQLRGEADTTGGDEFLRKLPPRDGKMKT